MKTLRECLEENKVASQGWLYFYYAEIEKAFLEWLAQNRKEYEESSKDYAIHRRICIDKLIEELTNEK